MRFSDIVWTGMMKKAVSFICRIPENALVALIGFYRRFISPMKPRCCRFVPSCSEYAIEAVRMHGVLRGVVLAIWRIMRCHPFWHGDMYDPVPRTFAGSRADSESDD